jgi:hypothetical protein
MAAVVVVVVVDDDDDAKAVAFCDTLAFLSMLRLTLMRATTPVCNIETKGCALHYQLPLSTPSSLSNSCRHCLALMMDG